MEIEMEMQLVLVLVLERKSAKWAQKAKNLNQKPWHIRGIRHWRNPRPRGVTFSDFRCL